ncbi:MAG: pyridoxamine kinase [Oscillospiraceae bacterium]|nr:pyridoxamine kinase [Oscillospiraceae bacterium]
MENHQMRVAAIQSMAGFGRCSMAVILPVISAMGVQVCPVPTAVLSTHTGGLGDVVLRDMTDYLAPSLEHYKQLDIGFDCIYSGFLGSVEQVDRCLEFFRAYPGALTVADPVMGDHGKPYRTCGPELRGRMGELVAQADIITPNVTEAAFLLGSEYPRAPITAEKAKGMLARLGELGPERVVITSVSLADGSMANLGYDRSRAAYWRVNYSHVPAAYPGTGDIFASVLVGGLLTGDSLPIAMDRATKFTEITVKTTYGFGTDTRFGVMFEKSLHWLRGDNVLTGYSPL